MGHVEHMTTFVLTKLLALLQPIVISCEAEEIMGEGKGKFIFCSSQKLPKCTGVTSVVCAYSKFCLSISSYELPPSSSYFV